MSDGITVTRGASKTDTLQVYTKMYMEYLDHIDNGEFVGTFEEWIRLGKMNDLARQQEVYEGYWVKNAWGFGDKMRDYLFSGQRRIRFSY